MRSARTAVVAGVILALVVSLSWLALRREPRPVPVPVDVEAFKEMLRRH